MDRRRRLVQRRTVSAQARAHHSSASQPHFQPPKRAVPGLPYHGTQYKSQRRATLLTPMSADRHKSREDGRAAYLKRRTQKQRTEVNTLPCSMPYDSFAHAVNDSGLCACMMARVGHGVTGPCAWTGLPAADV